VARRAIPLRFLRGDWRPHAALQARRRGGGGLSGREDYPGRSSGKRRAELGLGTSHTFSQSLPSLRERTTKPVAKASNSSSSSGPPPTLPVRPPSGQVMELLPPIGSKGGKGWGAVLAEGLCVPLEEEGGSGEPWAKKLPTSVPRVLWKERTTSLAAVVPKLLATGRHASETEKAGPKAEPPPLRFAAGDEGTLGVAALLTGPSSSPGVASASLGSTPEEGGGGVTSGSASPAGAGGGDAPALDPPGISSPSSGSGAWETVWG